MQENDLEERTPPFHLEQAADQYSVLALGPPGSGKTVYLAMLYDSLTHGPQLVNGIDVSLRRSENADLTKLYREVADSTSDWPPPTQLGVFREANFSCRLHRTRSTLFGKPKELGYELINFRYLDYSGEILSSIEEGTRFDKELDRADAFFALLDGLDVLEARNDPDLADDFFRSWQPIVNILKYYRCPTFFLLTKWDLVKEHMKLGEVSRLLSNSSSAPLNQFISSRSHRTKLRRKPVGGVTLIPVSSVGDGFATLSSSGQATKVQGAVPSPENLTVPIEFAIAEIAQLALEDIQAAGQHEGPEPDLAEDLQKGADAIASDKIPSMVAFGINAGISITRAFSRPVRRMARKTRREARKVRAHRLDGVRSREGAMYYLVHDIQERVDYFVDRYGRDTVQIWRDPSVRENG